MLKSFSSPVQSDKIEWSGTISGIVVGNDSQAYYTDGSNFRRKWVSQCYIVNLAERMATAFLDGKRIGQVGTANKFAKEHLLKSHEPLLVTIGCYMYDNKPMIGKIVDINMWSRHLTEEEAMRYSDCSQYVKRRGDLIDKTTEFHIAGANVERIYLDSKEVLCDHESSTIQLFLHAPFMAQTDAKQACDKYLMNSMAGPFKDIDGDWKVFHERGSTNNAVKNYCWTGGRILVWQSYKCVKDAGKKSCNFVHVGTNEGLQIHPWQPSQPDDNLCAMGYHGSLYTSSWRAFSCVKTWQWAGCAGCWLPNTFSNGIVIHMRGLCVKTLFDTVYQVG